MKIVIANQQVPFIQGGAEALTHNLRKALEEEGHETELVRIPFKWYPLERIPEHILACRLLDLTDVCGDPIDLLIGIKFPAYYIPHPNKILWIAHQHRHAYDLWGTRFCGIPNTQEGLKIREIIINSDKTFLREAKKIYTTSRNVSNRLKKFNEIDSVPLYHPPPDYEELFCGDFDDYVFYPSRFEILKRQELAIEAMKYTATDVKLVIAGNPNSDADHRMLVELVRRYRLEERVKVIPRFPDLEEKLKLFADSCGILFIPYDEDYGYVTLQGMYAKKPIITCTDSGTTLEFVEHKVNGFVVSPDPRELARAIDELYLAKDKAKQMGMRGYEKIISMDLSWKKVVKAILNGKT